MSKNTDLHLFVDRMRNGNLEYLEDLFNMYSYITLNYYGKYEGKYKTKAKELADEMLKEVILDFIKNSKSDDYRISAYIYYKFKNFDKKLGFEKKQKQSSLKQIENESYKKNIDARVKILLRRQHIIDKWIDLIYDSFIGYLKSSMESKEDFTYLDDNFEFADNMINKDDIIQELYLYAWQLINEYYNKESNAKAFSDYFNQRLRYFCERKLDKIKNKLQFELSSFVNLECCCNECDLTEVNLDYYDNKNPLYKIEQKEMIDRVKDDLNGNLKKVFDLVFSGYSFKEAGDILGITRTRAHQTVERVKILSKKKGFRDNEN